MEHENLVVFAIGSQHRDETDFLTLEEGLKDGSAVVAEKASAQVNELEIENGSDRPLYVQVGDRLKGGRQDRIVGLSFVVPPHSGRQPVRSFCVEHDRWSPRAGGAQQLVGGFFGGGGGGGGGGMAPQSVRAAAIEGDQGAVWQNVSREKGSMTRALAGPNTNANLNESLDSPEVAKASRPYTLALSSALDGQDDAVGVAFAVNGKVVEVDLYPGHALLVKLYPKLLATFACQAATARRSENGKVSVTDVLRFLDDGVATGTRQETVLGNDCDVTTFTEKLRSRTRCNGETFLNVTAR